MENCSCFMAVCQVNRVETAVKVQDVLTQYGCHIRIRLGVHDSNPGECTNTGMILLQVCGGDDVARNLEQELLAIPNVKVKYMMLDF